MKTIDIKWNELEDELAQRIEWTEWKMDCWWVLLPKHCRYTCTLYIVHCTEYMYVLYVHTLLKPVSVGNHISKYLKVSFNKMHYSDPVSEGSTIIYDGIQCSKCKSLTSKKELKNGEEKWRTNHLLLFVECGMHTYTHIQYSFTPRFSSQQTL